jgi:23S rRNA pseudouridine1911/1915/1917 synthase
MPSSTAWSTEPSSDSPPGEGWLRPAANRGWIYRDRIDALHAGRRLSAYYASRHPHSSESVWRERLANGEIRCNGRPLQADIRLDRGDRLAWHRPPWREPAVPAAWRVVFDDGDLHVIDKPPGLPVLPAGGFLEHTLLRLLERRHAGDPAGVPRPVHRLGRFTSGLLVCARRPATRAWLSSQLRQTTAVATCGNAAPLSTVPGDCRKHYLALVVAGGLPLAAGESVEIAVPIGRRPHPRLGRLWAAAAGDSTALPARSRVTLLRHGACADLVEVAIATGRPHQIRIHCAALGAPLLGDPLYRPGGDAWSQALPGEGGYRLHAHRLRLRRSEGVDLALETPPPPWSAVSAFEGDQA